MTKLFLVPIVLMVALAGCTNTLGDPLNPNTVYTDNDVPLLRTEIVNTVCSVSGKTVIHQEDITRFQTTAVMLSKYQGQYEKDFKDVSSQLLGTADTWSLFVGKDLGKDHAQQLTDICNKVKVQYEATR